MKKRIFKIGILVAVILVCMIISTVESDKNRIVSDITGIVATPFQKAIVAVNNMIDYGGDYFQDMQALKEENAELKSKIILMEEKITESDEIRSENERLRTLVDLKEKNKN